MEPLGKTEPSQAKFRHKTSHSVWAYCLQKAAVGPETAPLPTPVNSEMAEGNTSDIF